MPHGWERQGRARTVAVVDAALAVSFVALNLTEVLTRTPDGIQSGSTRASVVVLALFSLPLVWRRSAPIFCWATMHGTFLISGLIVQHAAPAFGTSLPSCLVTFTVARHGPRPWARYAWLSGPLLWLSVVLADGKNPRLAAGAVFLVTTSALAWGGGWLLRGLAERQELLMAAQERLQEALLHVETAAVQQERVRIVGELNQSVTVLLQQMLTRLAAHTEMLQGGGADVTRLSSAQQVGEQALAELQVSLGLLHPNPPEAERAPSLDGLPELLASLRAAGLEIQLTARLDHHVPEAQSQTAYRLLQEALVNVLKHGGGARADAVVEARPEEVVLLVRNEVLSAPSAPSVPAGGHGLIGMRERAAAFGGCLHAGLVEGVFVVEAVLPLRLAVTT